mmetsp:Transcript_72121/g.211306  ORF Transcript_72121/g.211306 Transcript_72121/m.211306 type:complete len:214 (-) Transcript_72121:874-1515(-)
MRRKRWKRPFTKSCRVRASLRLALRAPVSSRSYCACCSAVSLQRTVLPVFGGSSLITSLFSLLRMSGAARTCSVRRTPRSTRSSSSPRAFWVHLRSSGGPPRLELSCGGTASSSASRFPSSRREFCTGVPVSSSRRLARTARCTSRNLWAAAFFRPCASSQIKQSKETRLKSLIRSSFRCSAPGVVSTSSQRPRCSCRNSSASSQRSVCEEAW